MAFSRLVVNFNLKEYNGLANMLDAEQLRFASGEHRILSFKFAPKNDRVQRTIEVSIERPNDRSLTRVFD